MNQQRDTKLASGRDKILPYSVALINALLCGMFVSGLYDNYLENFSVEMVPSYLLEFSLTVPAAES